MTDPSNPADPSSSFASPINNTVHGLSVSSIQKVIKGYKLPVSGGAKNNYTTSEQVMADSIVSNTGPNHSFGLSGNVQQNNLRKARIGQHNSVVSRDTMESAAD